jgi:DNA-binding NarL/FixJ family response regulator
MRESAVCCAAQAGSSCAQGEGLSAAGRRAHAAAGRRVHADTDHGGGVLLVTDDGDAERTILRSLKQRRLPAEWTRSVGQLKTRVARDDLRAPEVVFLDLELPEVTGEDWVCMVRRGFVRAAVIAFGEDLSAARAARLLALGVPSLHKPVEPLAFAHLALALRAAQAPEPRTTTGEALARAGASSVGHLDSALESYAAVRALSKQQRLILRFYLSGENDKEIARTLLCSEATVYEHWRRMGKKAGGTAKSAVISDFHRFLVRS